MNEVYLIQGEIDYEGYDILGVFSTQDEAQSALQTHLDSIDRFDRYDWYQIRRVPFGRKFDRWDDDAGETVYQWQPKGLFS